ncbi:MAG: glycosyltransferase family 4 protein [Anaerolineae bacterium]|nr:glycosyltransferase family 4 protein [Anaerolineae bacterium]
MQSLDGRPYKPLLVTTEGMLPQRARALEIPVWVQEFPWFSRRRPWEYLGAILRLAWIIRKYRVALVHTNCPHSLHYVRRACRLTGAPYVSHVRDSRDAWFFSQNVQALNEARRVIANSQAAAGVFVSAGIDAGQIEVIYNPIDFISFAAVTEADVGRFRKSQALSPELFLVGLVGQIQETKGHETLIQAIPMIVEAVPNAKFLIVGAAFDTVAQGFELRIRQQVVEMGLSPYVSFLGFRDDVPVVMRSLDLLVVPSWNEAFGRVVVEGLAAGCPVVGTRAGGIPEIITDGIHGLLVSQRDPMQLAQAVIRLAKDRVLYGNMRQLGLERAQAFAPQRHAERIQSLYDEVLGRTRLQEPQKK